MRLRPEKLASHLEQTLAPVYIVTGDETLLVQEACDSVRSSARRQGFEDREVFDVGKAADWQQIMNEANSLSLFAQQRIFEVRLTSAKPGKEGSQFFIDYCQQINPDNLLLVIMPKLDRSAQSSKWFRALDEHGVVIQVWPVDTAQLPAWIQRRLRARGIDASQQAVEILADRVEGNLLAASQEIEKLGLLSGDTAIDADTMSAVVADSSRYNVFDLTDRILAGDQAAAARTLRGLRDEGTDATVILWAVARELRALLRVSEAVATGRRTDDALDDAGVWDKQKPRMREALRRLRTGQLIVLLRQAAMIDRMIKGLAPGSPWLELTNLTLSLSGANPLHPSNIRLTLREQTI